MLSSIRQFQLNWASIITTCLPPQPNRNSSNLQYHRSETLYTSISSKNMDPKLILDTQIFRPKFFLSLIFFRNQHFFLSIISFWPKFFSDQIFFLAPNIFLNPNFWTQNLFGLKSFCWHKSFWTSNWSKKFWTQNYYNDQKISLL